MSNGRDVHHHHHHRRHFHHHKNMFLPMFCRLSIKDILYSNHHRKTPISAPASPSSPKVSCMGQVKRNNRVVGFPAAGAGANHKRHSGLRNLFSTNNTLLQPTAPIKTAARCRSKSFRKLKNECQKQEDRVDIGEIDPPLPVVKRVAPPTRAGLDEVNLWRRRSNGAVALKGLQIEQSIVTRTRIISRISQRPTHQTL